MSASVPIPLTFHGQCCCGAIQLEMNFCDESSSPLFCCLCHCLNCRKATSSAAGLLIGLRDAENIADHVPSGPAFKVTDGTGKLKQYHMTPKFRKAFCGECGTTVYQGPLNYPMVVTYPTLFEFAGRFPNLPTFLHPTCSYNFENCILPQLFSKEDGVPRFKDFPKEFGGSGDIM